MITPLEFFGGAIEVTTSSAITLDMRARIWRIKTSTASLTMRLPPITTLGLPIGGPVFIVINAGKSENGNVAFSLRDTENASPAVSLAVSTGGVGARANVVCSILISGVLSWAYQPIAGSQFDYTTY